MYIRHQNSKSISAGTMVNRGLSIERQACETAAETMFGTQHCATSFHTLNADSVHLQGAQQLAETVLYKDMLLSS